MSSDSFVCLKCNESSRTMKINIEIDQDELKTLIYEKIQDSLGSIKLDPTKVTILVKSTQNWKSEWESADFKATYSVDG